MVDGRTAFVKAAVDDLTGDYDRGEIRLSTRHDWDSSDAARGTFCHEIDHLMGLGHVWWDDMFGVDNVGSKATA